MVKIRRSIHNIIHENDSLKNENKDLKERCENLVYAMGALKGDVTNLEEEKKSLISVLKLLQVDTQQHEQKSRVIESNADKVTDRSKQKTFDYANEMEINNLLHEYRDLFIDMAVRNNRSKLAIANRHQER